MVVRTWPGISSWLCELRVDDESKHRQWQLRVSGHGKAQRHARGVGILTQSNAPHADGVWLGDFAAARSAFKADYPFLPERFREAMVKDLVKELASRKARTGGKKHELMERLNVRFTFSARELDPG